MLSATLLLLTAQDAFVQKIPNSTIEFQMVPVPAGKVKIGKETIEVKPFFMSAKETTWDQFDAFLLSGEPSKPYEQAQFAPDAIARPSRTYNLPDLGWGHQGFPVININHLSAEMYCRWLSSVTKKKYRLPSEAEWELAAREGSMGEWKMTASELSKREWIGGGTESTQAGGKKAANKFGIYDLLGNVGEWTYDLKGKPVLCGGDFQTQIEKVNPAMRRYPQPSWQERDPQIPKSRWWLSDGFFAGFRVVCDP